MQAKPDISVLSFDVSHNCLGRALMLAEILGRRFDVEIVGPAANDGIWYPARNSQIAIKYVKQGRCFAAGGWRRLQEMVRGRAVYAVKPRLASLGTGLLARRRRGVPLVLDIDDWELGFYLNDLGAAVKADLRNPGNPNNLMTTWIMEKMVGHADAVTTSSAWLNRRFGGLMVPHCRDTAMLDPGRFDRQAERRRLGWEDSVVALFLGTPAAHKGIDVLIEAIKKTDPSSGMRLAVAGVPENNPLWQQDGEDGGRINVMGQLPLEEVPRLLAAADIVTVPQLPGPASVGQVPAKLVDAMAMGKAIIASGVSDIPGMLEDCGVICRPGDAAAMAVELERLAADRDLRERLGAAARTRAVNRYSYDAMEERLAKLFGRVAGLAGRAS